MSRGRKLWIVGWVLAVGFGLAWPFRKTTSDKTFEESVATMPAIEPSPSKTTVPFPSRLLQIGSPAPHVAAKMTSIAGTGAVVNRPSTTSFDLANHPALAAALAPRAKSPRTPASYPKNRPDSNNFSSPPQVGRPHARPAYATADRDHAMHAWEQREAEIRHVVQNNDTLDKLAKRYLGDEGRALEIFDRNRDLLDNPHLLPIGAELSIPADLRKSVD